MNKELVQHHTKLLIIGAGPAGYTAAIYGARAGLSPSLVQGMQPGGQLMVTTDVENYPGFAEAIQGPWLMEQMRDQAASVGAQLFQDVITSLDLSHRPFICRGEKWLYSAEALIICTGAEAKWLGIESEQKFRGYGVSACATCDGFFYKNKTVAVVGGGNTAVEEALFLTRHAKDIFLIHRRDSLRAEHIMQQRLLKNPKVHVFWNSVVEEVLGTDSPLQVNGVRIRSQSSSQNLDLDGLFIAIGHKPNTSLVKDWLELDSAGYIVGQGPGMETQIPGVFAAGDVRDPIYRQAITSAGQGCMAAIDAEKFLSSL